MALQLAISVVGLLGAFLGGEHRAGETAFVAAREAVSDQLEDKTFRALEAEAEVALRVPPSVTVHLAQTIDALQKRVTLVENKLASCQQGE